MKRILLIFTALITAAVALCLWYLPASMYVPVRRDPVPPAPTTAPLSTKAVETLEPEPTSAPTPPNTPVPTPAPMPEATPESGDGPEGAPPGETPAVTPEEAGDIVDIEGAAATTAPLQNEVARAAPRVTPIPATPRTAPPDAPLALEPSIDDSQMASGVIEVRYYNQSNPKLKFQIKKNKTYSYNMQASNAPYRYPLNMGDGQYEISILENIKGTEYKPLSAQTLNVQLSSANAPYLQSIQLIDWDPSMAPILEALKFQADAGGGTVTDDIYKRLVNYLSYDFDKLRRKLPSGYIPDITDTYETGLGICYDMSALYASMLRSVGVPARLMMGYTKWVNGYHAWNEVLVNGDWVVVDLSTDTQLRDFGDDFAFAKKKTEYNADKVY